MKIRRRRRAELSMPVTSMGDIAFLLTIFFILTSNFVKEASIKVAPPKSPDVAALQQVPVSVVIDENSVVYVNGRRVADADAVESAVGTVLQRLRPEAQKAVVFRCDRSVDKSVFEPVLDAISRAGGTIFAVGEKK